MMKQYKCIDNRVEKDVVVSYDSTCMMIEFDKTYIISIFPETKTFIVDIIGGN